MKKSLFIWVFFCLFFSMSDAFAIGDEIFDSLAKKAKIVGDGLGQTGFFIAGFGLIVFSFMALFNKISWKTLAYIMLSTFILSVMTMIIDFVSDGAPSQNLSYSSSGTAATTAQGNVKNNPVTRGN